MKSTKSKCHLSTNYAKKLNKRFVQSFLYRTSLVRGNVLMLCGPALKEHVKDAKIIMIGQGTCNIYENNIDTYNQNIEDLKTLKSVDRFNIKHQDILGAKVCRFVDLDFCATLDSTIHIVQHMFREMLYIKHAGSSKLNKHLLITFSNRGSKRKYDISKLCGIFDITNDFIRDESIPGVLRFKHRTCNASYISYRDGMPMTTFSYQWK